MSNQKQQGLFGRTVKKTLVAILWGSILTGTIGRIFSGNKFTEAIWGIILFALFAYVLVIPTLEEMGIKVPLGKRRTSVLDDIKKEQDAIEAIKRNAPRPSAEVDAYRNAYLQDIYACLAETGLSWSWASMHATQTVILTDGKVSFQGKLSLDTNQRVVYISATINGEEQRFFNSAYLAARRVEQQIFDAPIVEFIKNTIPDAVWYWDNIESRTIILSSKAKKIDNILCHVNKAFDGHISSLSFTTKDGVRKYITARAKRKTDANASPSKTTVPATAGTENATRTSEFTSVVKVASPTSVQETEDTKPESEDIKDFSLKTTDEPPVSDDDIRRSTKLVADYVAADINELATSAENEGRHSIVLKWPEGIQTLREAEFFAEAVCEGGNFTTANIDAKKEIVEFAFS